MTFEEFKADFLGFLQESTINLGRKNTKSKEKFLQTVSIKFDAYGEMLVVAEICDDKANDKKKSSPLNKSVICIKPTDPRRALNAGKGVHAMNTTESSRADEQLGRSPFTGKAKTEESKDV